MNATQASTIAIRELLAGETRLAHRAMHALRPAHASERKFVEHVDHVLRPAGYRLLGTFLPSREQAAAVAGFRIADSLAWGSPPLRRRRLHRSRRAAPGSRRSAPRLASEGGAKARMRSAAPGLGDRCRAVRRAPALPQPWAGHLLTPFRSRAVAARTRRLKLGDAGRMRRRGTDRSLRDLAIRDSGR
jgi:hypothetical protein